MNDSHDNPSWSARWPPPALLAPPPPLAPPPRRRRSLKTVTVVVMLVAGLVAVGMVLGRVSSDRSGWAKAWDARVEPLARFVEAHRGLTFVHPVGVDFVAEATFVEEAKKSATGDEPAGTSDVTDDPLWRALGLVSESFDHASAASDAATGIVGFYDPSSHRIRVRGVDLTAEARTTLVHELTHALQDQRFELDALWTKAHTNDAQLALRAVIEGDAVVVEDEYREQLSDADRSAIDAAEAKVTDAPELGRVPLVIDDEITFLYGAGPAFVRAVEQLGGGRSRRDRLFAVPPASELEILYPDQFLAGVRITEPTRPALQPSEKIIRNIGGADDVGVLRWLSALGQRLDARVVVKALGGWGGDASTAFRQNGKICVRATVVGRTTVDTSRLADVLEAWAKAGPADAAHVDRNDAKVTLTACEGPGVAPAADAVEAPIGPFWVLAARTALVATESSPGDDTTLAERSCVGDTFVDLMPLERLAADESGESSDAIAKPAVDQAARACGVVISH
jgi:hypothetical protein